MPSFTVGMKKLHGTRLFYMQHPPQVQKNKAAVHCNSETLRFFFRWHFDISIKLVKLDNKIKIFFFGPRTSIGELRSTFCAEFRYVYILFLSGRFSKIQRTIFVQKSTLRTNEAGRNLPLKCRGVWRSPVFGFWYIPLQCLAIVCQRIWGPLALVPLFRSQNDWVNYFTVFVTDFAEIFWKKKKNSTAIPKSWFSDSYCIPYLCTKSTGPAQHPDSSLLCDFLRSPLNPSAWSDGHCPHAVRSHSFVYISTS